MPAKTAPQLLRNMTKIDFSFIFHLFVFQKMLSKTLPIDMLLPGCQRPGSFALIQIGGKTPFNLTNQEIRCSVLSWSLHKQLMQYHLLNFHLCQCYPLFYTFFNIIISILIFMNRKWIKWKIHSLKVGLQGSNNYCSEIKWLTCTTNVFSMSRTVLGGIYLCNK